MSKSHNEPSNEILRQLLLDAFDKDELIELCFDRFPEVFENRKEGWTLGQLVLELVWYCTRQNRIGELLRAVKELRPEQFQRYAPYLTGDDDSWAVTISVEGSPTQNVEKLLRGLAWLLRAELAVQGIVQEQVGSGSQLTFALSSTSEVRERLFALQGAGDSDLQVLLQFLGISEIRLFPDSGKGSDSWGRVTLVEIPQQMLLSLEPLDRPSGGHLGRGRPDYRLDAAVPDEVMVDVPFDLAVAVRLADSPLLQVEELERVRSGQVEVEWPKDSTTVDLRASIRAPHCRINGAANQMFRLHAGKDSPVVFFSLTPLHVGDIPILVTVYQSVLALGSARLKTIAGERVAGMVTTSVVSGTTAIPMLFHDMYSLLLRAFSMEELVTLADQIHVDIEDLPGKTRFGKARELVAYCHRRGLVDQLIAQIIAARPNWVDLMEGEGQ